MPTLLRGLRLAEISLVDSPANRGARVAVFKRAADGGAGPHPGQQEETPEMTIDTDGDLTARIAELTKRLAAAEAGQAALEAAVAAAGATVEKAADGAVTVTLARAAPEETIDFDGEKIAKSALPEPVLKKLLADRARIAKLEAQREAEVLEKRAEAELPALVGTAATRAALLKAVDGIAEEAVRAAVAQTLKAANDTCAALGKGLGHRGGPDGDGAGGGASALETKAAELMKAEPALTKAQAIAKALRADPGLYEPATPRKETA